MQLHTQLLRAVLLSEIVAIPDILFFTNPELLYLIGSNEPQDVAIKQLLLEAVSTGIIRPTMRLKHDGAFIANLKRAEKDGSSGITEGSWAFAKLLDGALRLRAEYVFENWPDDGYNGGLGPQSFYEAVKHSRGRSEIKNNALL
jgi:hypothetical protein